MPDHTYTAPTDDEIKTAVTDPITSTKTMCKHYENAEYNEFLEAFIIKLEACFEGFYAPIEEPGN